MQVCWGDCGFCSKGDRRVESLPLVTVRARGLRRKTQWSLERFACFLSETPAESRAEGWERLGIFWNLLESSVCGWA